DIIGNDVVDAVKWLFLHGEIPKGGNSSFITLIPKVPNANMVKDFRHISLIGSLYKVIAKVLANCLVTVLDDIVDEIQSAFVTDRQILDGPFILNEIVHWCKNKKKQSMIFKVDFEKVYDSVNLTGSSSLQISHLFYADDAFFMGQWSQCNIDTIIRVLDVFYRASCLRINMNKSNLMGISVDSNKVLRFFSQKNSLWVRVVKALHGEDEKIGKKVKPRWSSSLVGSGDFSMSLVRKFIDNAILPKGISKTRWIKKVPIKINVHAWKVIHDCLPTRFNISQRENISELVQFRQCELSVCGVVEAAAGCGWLQRHRRKEVVSLLEVFEGCLERSKAKG
nr:RNA-directed DNA polymerase, eukaryota, reverse transcriptase zinc-binding domain protein [Tanacetum cinerariifolium]